MQIGERTLFGKRRVKDKKLLQEFEYLHNKVEQMEEERQLDRSWEGHKILKDFKKMKLRMKDILWKKNLH